MKILVINYRFHFSGGPERYMFNIIEELEKRGHEIITFSVKNCKNEFSPHEKYFARNIGNSNEYLYERFKKDFLFFYDYLTREFYSFYLRRKLNSLIRQTAPEVCYLLPHKASLSPSIIDELKRNKIPIIHRISDYNIICPQGGLYRDRRFCEECKTSKLNVIKHKCIKNSYIFSTIKYLSSSLHNKLSLYNKVDHFITTNNFAKEKFIDFGFEDNKFTTITTFASVINRKKNINSLLPIKFICIGNTDDSKGTYDLIEASKSLIDIGYEEKFTINIYGGLREYERIKIKKLIEQNNLERNILFHGALSPDKITNVYKNSDVTIIPARWVENLPNVLVESLSEGTPVIVPNFGSFSSTVDESVAYFFTSLDVISLSETLKYVIDNPKSIVEKSIKCFEFSNHQFNKNSHIHNLLDIFNKFAAHENN